MYRHATQIVQSGFSTNIRNLIAFVVITCRPYVRLPLFGNSAKEFTLYKSFPLLPRPPNLLHQRPCAADLTHAHILYTLDASQDSVSNTLLLSLYTSRKHWEEQTCFGIATLRHPLQGVKNLTYSMLYFTCRARQIVNPSKQMNKTCPMKCRIRGIKPSALVVLVNAYAISIQTTLLRIAGYVLRTFWLRVDTCIFQICAQFISLFCYCAWWPPLRLGFACRRVYALPVTFAGQARYPGQDRDATGSKAEETVDCEISLVICTVNFELRGRQWQCGARSSPVVSSKKRFFVSSA
jgi:hypothetical protein